MLRTHILKCRLGRGRADALNRESGRIYTHVLVRHYRICRKQGIWLSSKAAERISDALDEPAGLHAHSIDAAQQAFYEACKVARKQRKQGLDVKYPYKKRRFRPTIWKDTAIRKDGVVLLLSCGRGNESVRAALSPALPQLPEEAFREARLVFNRHGFYEWHLVVEDGAQPAQPPGAGVVAVDLGEVQPATATDGEGAVVFSARALRSINQGLNRRQVAIQRRQAAKKPGSRGWRRLQRRKKRFLTKAERQKRDILHKVSRAVVDFAAERKAGTVVVGDVRDVADGKRLRSKSQQKVSQWPHGRLGQYIAYKADSLGMECVLEEEHYTSQTCPGCGNRYKPRGRIYSCPVCGLRSHRDVIGAINILSRALCGDVGRLEAPKEIKYRHPFVCGRRARQMCSVSTAERGRSRLDTAEMAAPAATSLAA